MMEAVQLKTVDDLLLSPDERVELIGGDLVRRPMTRFVHARTQGSTRGALHGLTRDGGAEGEGGWWIVTDVSVAYEAHERPSHDLSGWRRERLPGPETTAISAQTGLFSARQPRHAEGQQDLDPGLAESV